MVFYGQSESAEIVRTRQQQSSFRSTAIGHGMFHAGRATGLTATYQVEQRKLGPDRIGCEMVASATSHVQE